jgi:hypothetical protein
MIAIVDIESNTSVNIARGNVVVLVSVVVTLISCEMSDQIQAAVQNMRHTLVSPSAVTVRVSRGSVLILVSVCVSQYGSSSTVVVRVVVDVTRLPYGCSVYVVVTTCANLANHGHRSERNQYLRLGKSLQR